MIPSARTKAALEILERIESSRIPMDLTIGDYMRNRRYIGSKDRADIVERIYSLMRHWARLNWALESCGVEGSARNLLIAHLLLVEHTTDIAALFDGTKYAPDPLTADEMRWTQKLASIDFAAAPEAIRVECPPMYEASLREYFGANFALEMTAFMEGATLDLRVNTVLSDVDTVQAMLKEDRVKTAPLAYSPWGLRVAGKTYLSETKAFRKGWIDIQDEGSQLIALACGVKPGQQVLDYCAGAGGKTLALANAMKKKGRIVAMDMEAARLDKARERFRRAHVSDIIEPRPLSDERHRKWLRRQKKTFDVVLTDVPCSGTGTWRRNPDTRWRIYGPALDDILTTQAEILDKVAPCIKVGGKLVYATCSILAEENEKQVDAFLGRHPEFRLAELSEVWPDDAPVPCQGAYMRLTPHRHKTDGFFAAVLIRVKTEADQDDDPVYPDEGQNA